MYQLETGLVIETSMSKILKCVPETSCSMKRLMVVARGSISVTLMQKWALMDSLSLSSLWFYLV